MTQGLERAAAGLVLAGRFVLAVVRSGWQTTWAILRPARDARPGFVDYSFAPMGARATTLLACLVSLTPGTTAVDVLVVEGRMRLHLLDDRTAEAALAEIRSRFEPLVRALFPAGPRS